MEGKWTLHVVLFIVDDDVDSASSQKNCCLKSRHEQDLIIFSQEAD